MAEEGYKKKDIQRAIQKVHQGTAISSDDMSAAGTQRVEIGFPAEKITMVTTGNLVASVTPKIGAGNANAAIVANGTAATTTSGNMFAAVEIAWTSGSGRVIILAK